MGASVNTKVLCVLHALALTTGLASTADAASEPNQSNSFIQSAGRRVQGALEIRDDGGGLVADYALRLYEMEEAKQTVEFVGRCDSACTLFLALPPEQTCISEGAYFRFHAPSAPAASTAAAVAGYLMRKYPKWVRAWIVARGGLSDRLVTMNYDYANKFIRTCSLNSALITTLKVSRRSRGRRRDPRYRRCQSRRRRQNRRRSRGRQCRRQSRQNCRQQSPRCRSRCCRRYHRQNRRCDPRCRSQRCQTHQSRRLCPDCRQNRDHPPPAFPPDDVVAVARHASASTGYSLRNRSIAA